MIKKHVVIEMENIAFSRYSKVASEKKNQYGRKKKGSKSKSKMEYLEYK